MCKFVPYQYCIFYYWGKRDKSKALKLEKYHFRFRGFFDCTFIDISIHSPIPSCEYKPQCTNIPKPIFSNFAILGAGTSICIFLLVFPCINASIFIFYLRIFYSNSSNRIYFLPPRLYNVTKLSAFIEKGTEM